MLIFAGCDPIRAVEKSDNKVRDVFNYGLLHGILSCLPEIKEIHTSDTITKTDTVIETRFIPKDSLTAIHSIDTILKKVTITKNIFIHDTVYRTMRDLSKEDALRKDNAEKEGEIKAKNEIIEQQRKNNNWWKIRFFALLGLFTLYLFRKPLIRLISPAKL